MRASSQIPRFSVLAALSMGRQVFFCWLPPQVPLSYLSCYLGPNSPPSFPGGSAAPQGRQEGAPPETRSSASYLLLLRVVEGGGGVQHSFLSVIEELRDVLEVLGGALRMQRKRQDCQWGKQRAHVGGRRKMTGALQARQRMHQSSEQSLPTSRKKTKGKLLLTLRLCCVLSTASGPTGLRGASKPFTAREGRH